MYKLELQGLRELNETCRAPQKVNRCDPVILSYESDPRSYTN